MNEKYKTTILLTTHDLSDIEALCERVVMLDEGKVIYDGALEKLRAHWGEGKQIQFQFAEELIEEQLLFLTADLNVTWQKTDKLNVWTALVIDKEAQMSELIGRIVGTHQITDLSVTEISTEEVIRNIYEKGEALTS
jgi:ABC-2 type transport system ATP-binding protein